jgi:hypothetical protein
VASPSNTVGTRKAALPITNIGLLNGDALRNLLLLTIQNAQLQLKLNLKSTFLQSIETECSARIYVSIFDG